MVEKYLNVL